MFLANRLLPDNSVERRGQMLTFVLTEISTQSYLSWLLWIKFFSEELNFRSRNLSIFLRQNCRSQLSSCARQNSAISKSAEIFTFLWKWQMLPKIKFLVPFWDAAKKAHPVILWIFRKMRPQNKFGNSYVVSQILRHIHDCAKATLGRLILVRKGLEKGFIHHKIFL